jgi:peptidoglycan hydrolase-like protein with peptidoglycan-binding domain
MAHACIKAGVVKSTGQFGDIVLFLNKSGKGDGPACLSLGGKSLMSSDRMITGRIGYCTTSQIWSNLRLVGFVDPHRVPGWPAIPADPKPTVHPSGPVRGVNTYAKGLVFKTKLAAGSRGPFVCEIQYHLRVPVTGVYDAKTLAAVKAVQKRRFPLLGKADGIAGPVTYRTITGHK